MKDKQGSGSGGDFRYNFALYNCRILRVQWKGGNLLLCGLQNGCTPKGVCLYRTLYVKRQELLETHTIRALCFQPSILGYQRIRIMYKDIPQATELVATDIIAGDVKCVGEHFVFQETLDIDSRPRLSDFYF